MASAAPGRRLDGNPSRRALIRLVSRVVNISLAIGCNSHPLHIPKRLFAFQSGGLAIVYLSHLLNPIRLDGNRINPLYPLPRVLQSRSGMWTCRLCVGL